MNARNNRRLTALEDAASRRSGGSRIEEMSDEELLACLGLGYDPADLDAMTDAQVRSILGLDEQMGKDCTGESAE